MSLRSLHTAISRQLKTSIGDPAAKTTETGSRSCKKAHSRPYTSSQFQLSSTHRTGKTSRFGLCRNPMVLFEVVLKASDSGHVGRVVYDNAQGVFGTAYAKTVSHRNLPFPCGDIGCHLGRLVWLVVEDTRQLTRQNGLGHTRE